MDGWEWGRRPSSWSSLSLFPTIFALLFLLGPRPVALLHSAVAMRRLVVAIAVSALFVLSAPFMGQLRAALRNAFPGRFVAIVGAAILVALAAALLSAVVRIRARRVVRYGAIVAALIVAAAYSWYSSTGSPDADAVERVHFIEYGVLTFLFYRVWKQACDLSSFVLPVLAGVIVGTLDEWLQWFIPVRVGEARDVMLNLVSILCGLT